MNETIIPSLTFIKEGELVVVSTDNFGGDFIAAAVSFAIRTRIRSAKSIGQARRMATTFCAGQWAVPRARLYDVVREMPAERLARMLTNEQRQALRAAINNLPD